MAVGGRVVPTSNTSTGVRSSGSLFAVGRSVSPQAAPSRCAAMLVAVSALCVFMWLSPGARADSPTTLTVVGTSDVNDSGLSPNLIQPQFTQQFPQFTFRY